MSTVTTFHTCSRHTCANWYTCSTGTDSTEPLCTTLSVHPRAISICRRSGRHERRDETHGAPPHTHARIQGDGPHQSDVRREVVVVRRHHEVAGPRSDGADLLVGHLEQVTRERREGRRRRLHRLRSRVVGHRRCHRVLLLADGDQLRQRDGRANGDAG
jgi:hypothetical protein